MKKYSFIIMIIASVGCSKFGETEINSNDENNVPKVFFAETEDSRTKVSLVSDTGFQKHLAWNEGDEISVFYKNTSNAKYRFDGKDGDRCGSFSYVSSDSTSYTKLSTVYAVSPYSKDYSISDDEVLTLKVPSHQYYYPDTFDPAANIMVAVTDTPESDTLKFYPRCGYVIFQIYGNASIKSLVLSENSNFYKPSSLVSSESCKFLPNGRVEFYREIQEEQEDGSPLTLDCGDGVQLGSVDSPTQFCFVINNGGYLDEGINLYISDTKGNTMCQIKKSTVIIGNNAVSIFPPFEFNGTQETFVEIEDKGFERYCLEHFDYNKDGRISNIEAESVVRICLGNVNQEDYQNEISSLSGIEFFKNLNKLTIENTQISQLDLRGNRRLKELFLSPPYYSPSINTIELDCPELETLELYNLNINSLSTSSLSSLKNCIISNCKNLEKLSFDIDAPVLKIDCNKCAIKNLDVSKLPELKQLEITNCQIESLDLTPNKHLTSVNCNNNQLVSLMVDGLKSLEKLLCNSNMITSLDVSNLTAMATLDVEGNPLVSLDVSYCSLLRSLGIERTKIEEIDISKNCNLEYLGCTRSSLKTLDVSSCLALSTLYCNYCTSLKEIWMFEGQSISDFSYNPNITSIKYKAAPAVIPEAIDLGLSVKWASYNVGASTIYQYGSRFAWGETEPKTLFSHDNYKYYSKEENVRYILKYNYDANHGNVDNIYTLEAEDDAAHVQWGNGWRMPTKQEMEELCSNCDCKETEIMGVTGYLLTSRIPGYSDKSVFFPCSSANKGVWTSSLYVLPSTEINNYPCEYAYWLELIDKRTDEDDHIIQIDNLNRSGRYWGSLGAAVRPVHP